MEEFYTVNQAAIVLKVHSLTIRRYIKEGKLKAYRAGGNIRIALSDLNAFAKILSPKKLDSSNQQTIHDKQSSQNITKPFSVNDPLFRLKAKGISISKI